MYIYQNEKKLGMNYLHKHAEDLQRVEMIIAKALVVNEWV